MTGEGEGVGRVSPAPYSWRLRRPAGRLFALAGPGVALVAAATHAAARHPDALLRPAGAGVAAGVWVVEVGAVAALARALRRRRWPAPRQFAARPLPRLPAVGSPGARSSLPLAPGPASELLALFAAPAAAVPPRPTGPEPAVSGAPAASTPAARAPDDGDRPPLLRLFGPLRVERPDAVAPGLRSARGLIAYLALRGCPASFDELLEALWPGEHPSRTRPRLWKAKRRAVDLLGDALERRGFCYVIEPSRLRVDVSEVERLSRPGCGLAELEGAAALSTGEPLADVDYTFADSHRRRFQSLRADVLVRLARARLDAGQAGGALAAAEELIVLDRLGEQGWTLAMEAEAALGARQAIIDRYALLRRELDAALGLAPAAETRAVFHRLLGQR